jgi:hypothetical protein
MEQLALSASELAAMHDSPLWQLKAIVDTAARAGKTSSPIPSTASSATSSLHAIGSMRCSGVPDAVD